MPDLGPLVQAVAPLLQAALGSLLKTTLGMITLGTVLCAVNFHLAAQGSWLRGLIAALLALLLCAVLGGMLAVKRAVLTALLEGVRKLQLGNRLVGVLFDKIVGILHYGEEAQGDRGRELARTAERVPLAQAESALTRAIQGLVKADQEGKGVRNWLRKKIQHALLEKVENITLARFRQRGADVGGIDLELVRGELCAQMDTLLLERMKDSITRITVLFVLGAMLGASAVALMIREVPI